MDNIKRKHTPSEFAGELAKDGKKIALFGAGRDCLDVISFLYDNNIDVSWIIDNSPSKRGMLFKEVNSKVCGEAGNVRVISPEDLAALESPGAVRVIITALQHWDSMRTQLLQLGFRDFIFHYEYLWSGYSYTREEKEKIASVYSALEDELSRKIFEYWVKGAERADTDMFAKARSLSGGGSYVCPDFFEFRRDEIFADCGAYTGDTVDAFIKGAGGAFEKIYAFEPNVGTFEILREKFAGYDNIKTFNLGVSDAREEAAIDSYGVFDAGSNLIKSSGSLPSATVFTDTLDNICAGDAVSYIKMDIEGFELNALHGAKKIITGNRPKLAISVYHQKEDIYAIPLFIKELVPGYRLFFRSYFDVHYDAIIYAV